MSKTAQKTDPELWEKVKSELTRSRKGGQAGQWSARKAQLAVQEYKKRGGGYLGRKSDDDSLTRWTEEENRKQSAKRGADSKKKTPHKAVAAKNIPHAASKHAKHKKNELLRQARYLDIEGRSKMLKNELEDAIRLAKH